jgi:hypothetical protein
MIQSIHTPEGEKTMLLGYQVVRFMARLDKNHETELDLIDDAALIGFNTWAKRHNQPAITKEEMITWFDDIDAYTQVINSVKSFMENFTQRVSEKSQTPEKEAKK